MKAKCTLILLLFTYHLSSGRPAEEEKYTTRYDNFNSDIVIKNRRLIKSYIYCVLDKGPCVKESLLLKKNIPESLENECAKCSEKQLIVTKKIYAYLAENEPELYKELANKFDPDGKYRQRYKELAVLEGIRLP